ncbi:MAG: hypothetical protein SFV51_15735 [Bryobacteraceae bacterium]|nr:hypothetical protein [Bryobacteraceae bacterium]
MNSDPISIAGSLTGLDEKFLTPFDVTDPFNGELRLQGFLSQKPDHRYGALAITHVGEQPAPQLIYATPKLGYPFGRDGRFHFPPIARAALYEKLDGTNVLAYHYRDASGQRYLTYKLRLFPVLRNSRWGPFLDFWRELLARHPTIAQLAEENRCHISFEMYGARNAHLIQYENDLEAAVLFGVHPENAAVIAPFHLNLLNVPATTLIGELVAGEDPVARYGEVRAALEARNKPVEDEKLSGSEGAVWYVVEPSGRVTMWKCKPESVEQIHWAIGINKKAVIATCWNCLETSDELTLQALLPLLREEYADDDIERYRPVIEECIGEVRREYEFKERALAEYRGLGISIHEDKGAVMRALSKIFPRDQMKKVYAIIIARS